MIGSHPALAASGCGASATQTGGGAASSPEAAATPSAAPEVKIGTVADAVAAGWLAGNAQPAFPAGGGARSMWWPPLR